MANQQPDDGNLEDVVVPEKPSLNETIEALKTFDPSTPSRTIFYGLSGLNPVEIEQLADTWGSLSPDLRVNLLTDLVDSSEMNFELDYRELGLFALDDRDPDVRAKAVELLWEDESIELMERLMELTQWDESPTVRAAAASALGRFILLGEYEELPEAEAIKAQDAVINLLTDEDEDIDVRRRALEAIANSSHEIVEEAIREAYTSSEHKMKVSAIFAMGRSYDSTWRDTVLRELGSNDPEIRYEAARSAGELELDEAVPALGQLATQDEREVKEIAIWSLGEIGGKQALRILSALAEEAEEAEDENLIETIEDAIGNASLAGESFDFNDL
jgi:HEAT repeat protein